VAHRPFAAAARQDSIHMGSSPFPDPCFPLYHGPYADEAGHCRPQDDDASRRHPRPGRALRNDPPSGYTRVVCAHLILPTARHWRPALLHLTSSIRHARAGELRDTTNRSSACQIGSCHATERLPVTVWHRLLPGPRCWSPGAVTLTRAVRRYQGEEAARWSRARLLAAGVGAAPDGGGHECGAAGKPQLAPLDLPKLSRRQHRRGTLRTAPSGSGI
jgi:hypothetical protein